MSVEQLLIQEPATSGAFFECQTHDIIEHAQTPSGWTLNYEQVSAGKFLGQVCQLQLPNIQIIEDKTNQAMIKSGEAFKNSICFSVSTNQSPSDLVCLGNVFTSPGLLVSDSQNLPELRTPAGLRVFNLSVQKDLLIEYIVKQNLAFEPGCSPYFFPFDNSQGQKVIAQATERIFLLSKQGKLVKPVHKKNAQDLLLLHLLDASETACLPPISSTRKKQMVDRARIYAIEHSDTPFSIMDLCNHVGASRRKLQYCFQDVLGISPVSFLRILRLNAVHKALCTGGEEKQIQDIAAEWGFWHLGHFTSDYRNLFGERPSDTRSRTKSKFANLG
ncbi:helix-turn-helix domain-containing protein [Halomonas sp. FeN2]|uniref:helix-turn-helix domain-containing protein n=1 Tax=Halomonas sp. FeN2 TaxID=2832500 RepID=UPI001D0B1369|nr:helix-turn-helix domain-containing protein [Halomonas sp. FeN2]UBR51608.1 helix-turn-helix domain-containing protein [Halomonas sp. FeN2]